MISSFLLFCEIIEDLKKTTPKAWFVVVIFWIY